MEWIFIVIGLYAIGGTISWVYNKVLESHEHDKQNAVDEIIEEHGLAKEVEEARAMLQRISVVRDADDTLDDSIYSTTTANSIGRCPACKVGLLEVRKTYTGKDRVYGRYPTYKKYITCTNYGNCSYTEDYNKLNSRKKQLKDSVSTEFKNDFERAYK